MNQIRKALVDRNKLLFTETQKIFDLFSEKLNKAVQYFIKLDRDIIWGSIEFIPGTNDFVYLTGFLEIELGEKIIYNETKTIIVDEEYIKVNGSRTLIKILISVNDLETQSPKEIYEHIKAFYELAAVLSPEQIVKVLNSGKVQNLRQIINELIPPLGNTNLTPEPVNTEQAMNFDLSSLTEDQRQQVKFYTETTKMKN